MSKREIQREHLVPASPGFVGLPRLGSRTPLSRPLVLDSYRLLNRIGSGLQSPLDFTIETHRKIQIACPPQCLPIFALVNLKIVPVEPDIVTNAAQLLDGVVLATRRAFGVAGIDGDGPVQHAALFQKGQLEVVRDGVLVGDRLVLINFCGQFLDI